MVNAEVAEKVMSFILKIIDNGTEDVTFCFPQGRGDKKQKAK